MKNHQPLKLFKMPTLRIQLGVRLAAIAFGILTLNYVLVGIAMFAPIVKPMSAMLGFTAEENKELENLLVGVGDKHKAAVKTEIELAVKGLMTNEQFTAELQKAGINDKTIKELSDAVTKQGEQLAKMFAGKDSEHKSVKDILDEKKDAIKALATTNNRNETVKIIIPGTNKAQVTRASVSGSTMAMRLTEIGQLPYRGMVMSNLFKHSQVSPSSNGVIRYVDQAAITRGADMVAEGAVKPESAISWIERTLTIEKIADSIPVTKEAWNDVYFIQSEIERLLNINLALKEDQQLYAGTGATPQLLGVYTAAPAFVPATYADTVIGANLYDLIATVRTDIMTNKGAKYNPQTVVLNPINTLGLKLLKDAEGRYLLPPFLTSNGQTVDGLNIIESNIVAANTMLVGDFNYGTIYDLEDVTIEMGVINDQFIRNTRTILAEKRLALLIRNVDLDAFRKVTDIAAAIATITV